jgi:RNA-directed DNA polymerase
MNKGRNMPGVDKLVVKTPEARGRLVDHLMTFQPWTAKPARRVYIPKASGKLRPLSIPCVIDRCLQARVKNALEPAWEATFEGSSYGFRPGRGCHDAIEKIYLLARPNKRKKWVVDADIERAFDTIDQTYLLNALGHFPAREMIEQWLKAGYLDEGVFHETPTGTGQGSVISPLLANITLHGLEDALGVTHNNRGELTGPRAVVRYADDLVVFCESEEDAEHVVNLVADWLRQRGLALSRDKTRITHLTTGFDFLGWTIRHYPAAHTSASGYKLRITPSKDSVRRVREKLRDIWRRKRGAPVRAVLADLNPLIRGWAGYFRTVTASETFRSLDDWMYHKEVRYTKRAHPTKPGYWRKNRYWGRLNAQRDDTWVFGDKQTGTYLLKFKWFSIKRHILVKGTASPDDPNLRAYWRHRITAKATELSRSDRKIARAQHYVCQTCGESLFNEEDLHRHHVEPKRNGGKDAYDNLVLEHLYCHQQKHGSTGDEAIPAPREPTRSWLRMWLA